MKKSDKYPNLDDLLGAYFNQDWEDDYDSPEALISAFARDGDKKGIEDAISELKILLSEEHDKQEWYKLLSDDFGCCYALGSQSIDLKKVQLEEELALAEKKEEKMTKKELIQLIIKIREGDHKSEEEYNADLDFFLKNVPDPEASDLIHEPRLTPEEIVEKALAYKPIILPPPDNIDTNLS